VKEGKKKVGFFYLESRFQKKRKEIVDPERRILDERDQREGRGISLRETSEKNSSQKSRKGSALSNRKKKRFGEFLSGEEGGKEGVPLFKEGELLRFEGG